MKTYRSGVSEHGATNRVPVGVQQSTVRSGLVYLVTPNDVQELRAALVKGRLPCDFETKLAKLSEGGLIERYVEHYCRLFFAMLLAARNSTFRKASASDRERLLRVLAYVRKDDDAIPDYLPGGFMDDQQEVRAAAMELSPLLREFGAWRLRYQVPAMWRA